MCWRWKTSAAPLRPRCCPARRRCFYGVVEGYRLKKKLPNIEPLRLEIARLAHPGSTGIVEKKPAKRALPAAHWSEYERMTVAKAVAAGKRVYHVRVPLDPQCAMPIAARQMIKVALNALGEVLALYPGDDAPVTRVEIALASEKSAEQIRAKCRIPTIARNPRVTLLARQRLRRNWRDRRPLPNRSGQVLRLPIAEATSTPTPEDPAPATAAPASDTLFGSTRKRSITYSIWLANSSSAKSMLAADAATSLRGVFPKMLARHFSDAMAFQARALNDLQRSVMKIRMVPVEQLFRRFPRLVRDVAKQCGKTVELVIRGEDTDLDKRILDSLAEPLTHLVRNAVGHGIESGGTRRSRQASAGQATLERLSPGKSGRDRSHR